MSAVSVVAMAMSIVLAISVSIAVIGAEDVVQVLQGVVLSLIVAIGGVVIRVEILNVLCLWLVVVNWLVVVVVVVLVAFDCWVNVGVWVVDGDFVLFLWVDIGWLRNVVGVFWEEFTKSKLVEGEFRNGSVTLDNSLVALLFYGIAVAILNGNNGTIIVGVVFVFVLFLLGFSNEFFFSVIMDVLLFWFWFLLLVKLVVLWFIDRVTIDLLCWFAVEFIRLE